MQNILLQNNNLVACATIFSCNCNYLVVSANEGVRYAS